MFTGLVQAMGVVKAAERCGDGMRLTVAGPAWDLAVGESIAVQGCCLTVVTGVGGVMEFDLVPETLDKTTFGTIQTGARVNLERSLRVGDLLGGHNVQGHVDGRGTISRVQRGDDWRVWVRLSPELMRYMTPKGSVCVDGVSLTLASVDGDEIGLALIPTTLDLTTLKDLVPGDEVNIEADVMVKTMVHYLESRR